MVRAVIFDMDGTLIDTEKFAMEAWIIVMQKHGYSLPYEEALELRGLGKVLITEKFEKKYSKPFDYDTIISEVKSMIKNHIEQNGLAKKSGADKALDYLRQKGYRLAVATATEYQRACNYLDMVQLRSKFDLVISAEFVKRGKPYPDVYLYACEELGERPEDCIAVEDAPNGVLSGARAGCKVIMVPDLSEPDQHLSQHLYDCVASLDCLCDIL